MLELSIHIYVLTGIAVSGDTTGGKQQNVTCKNVSVAKKLANIIYGYRVPPVRQCTYFLVTTLAFSTMAIPVRDPAAAAATTTTPLINPQTATAAAVTGAGFINAATSQIVKAQADGPFTFRILGLIGGLAMVFSNGIAILDRFFSFNFAGAMIAVYGVFFGIIIVMLEGPFPFKERIQGGIRFHAKFLEFTWGRGALYFFVGTLQISNWNMLDWAVGGFMIFVGITAIGAGIASARDLKLLKFSMADEAKLKEQFNAHDSNGDGKLDVKELTAFVRDSGIEMNRNEIAAVFLALGKFQCNRG